ncbi:extensin family protein [Sulfitobacter sp. S190]|uniref:extensin-like domain-containing protein n=1 Tax=Sulfitobacter sp. S190 TaxID=2867022 RepID=UPI0021A27AC0|nr:extensin family protein [Sulfitobacter sp. S190]UWR21163.1 extensin family protein [Sulfitobacter sp. S190]
MMRFCVIPLICAAPLAAQELAPDVSPLPENRPAAEASAPPPKPQPTPSTELVSAGARDLLRLDDEAYATCLSQLDDMGVTYTEIAAIIPENDRDCGILRPVEVTQLEGDIAIEPAATLRCPTAVAVAAWARDFVVPASQRLDDRGALAVIENGSGYICRRRNNAADGKLSEHAFGNAMDIMGFRFDEGAPIAVQPREAEGSMAEAFQDAVRAAACLEFSTVLGPGSNAAHDDHLHLDIVARGSGYRLCEQGGATTD